MGDLSVAQNNAGTGDYVCAQCVSDSQFAAYRYVFFNVYASPWQQYCRRHGKYAIAVAKNWRHNACVCVASHLCAAMITVQTLVIYTGM